LSKEGREVTLQLTDLAVGAGNRDSVTAGVGRRTSYEVITLIGGDHEKRVLWRDSVVLQAREKCAKGAVVRLQLVHVSGLSRAKRAVTGVVVMRGRNVRVGHRNAMLLHGRDVAEGLRCSWVKAGKALQARFRKLASNPPGQNLRPLRASLLPSP